MHIGATKTGSSALQAHLFEGRRLLAEHGILYPDIGVVSNAHHVLLAAVHPGAWRMHRDILPAETDARLDMFRRMMGEIREAAERARAQHVVLSSEYLWGRLPPPLLKVLGAELQGYRTRVAAILRRQDSWFEASYLQAIKSGAAEGFDAWLETRLKAPFSGGGDFCAVLSFWQDAVATGGVVTQPYEFADRTRFTAGVVDLVCDRPLGERVVGAAAKFVNPSPNRDGLAALLALNRRKDIPSEQRCSGAREILRTMIRPERSRDPVVMSRDEAARLVERFASANRELARRFDDGRRGTYFDVSDLRSPATG